MPPFKDMFLSLPVWALLLAHMGNNWGMYTLLTEMPTYLTSVHHFDISSVSFQGIFGNFSVFLSFVGFFAEWLAFCPPLLSHVDVFHFLWAASLPPPVTGGEI